MTPRLLIPIQDIHLRGWLNVPCGSRPAQNILWFCVILWSFQRSSEQHKGGEFGSLLVWNVNTWEPSTEITAEIGYNWSWIRSISGEVGKGPFAVYSVLHRNRTLGWIPQVCLTLRPSQLFLLWPGGDSIKHRSESAIPHVKARCCPLDRQTKICSGSQLQACSCNP